ncbi:MAG: hypothetical protein M1546_00405 [Chloroflexi bacterium]|nr:hypothetical protein [Chloroflexota bacterium]
MKIDELHVSQRVRVRQITMIGNNDLGVFGQVKDLNAVNRTALVWFEKSGREMWINTSRLSRPDPQVAQNGGEMSQPTKQASKPVKGVKGIDVTKLSLNQQIIWRKPGRRFSKPVHVVAVNDNGHVVVSDQDQKRHCVPADQLSYR